MVQKDYLEECRLLFNEIGLYCDSDICRLIGYAEDDEDCYYLLMYPGGMLHYSSMVGPFESLKGTYKRYQQLEKLMTESWDCPPYINFVVKIEG